jgi:hypothetical protein
MQKECGRSVGVDANCEAGLTARLGKPPPSESHPRYDPVPLSTYEVFARKWPSRASAQDWGWISSAYRVPGEPIHVVGLTAAQRFPIGRSGLAGRLSRDITRPEVCGPRPTARGKFRMSGKNISLAQSARGSCRLGRPGTFVPPNTAGRANTYRRAWEVAPARPTAVSGR